MGTPCALARSGSSSALITSSSDRPGQATTGRRAITLKVQSSSIRCWTLSVRRLTMRLPPGVSDDALPRGWDRRRDGYVAHLEDSRGIPGPRHGDLLDRAKPESVGHCGRAVQLHAVCAPARREFGLQLRTR